MSFGIGISADYDFLHDPQQKRAAGYCPECGGELYAPSFTCSRCERRGRAEPLVKTREISFIVDASAPMHRAVREFLYRNDLKFREEVVSNV